MAEIIMSSGHKVLVDDEDYAWLSQWRWKPIKSKIRIYAGRNIRKHEGKSKYGVILMHRLIMDAPGGKQVDHVNRDALDNRRCNLRICNQGQNNAAGRPNRKKKYSQYKGVSIWTDGTYRLWTVRLKKNGKQHSGGYFKNEKEAALAYDKLARELWGDFAYQNFPSEQQEAAGDALESPAVTAVSDGRPGRLYRKGSGEGAIA